MTDERRDNDGVMWTRLSEVERQSAAHTTELRSIYAGLDEIRDVLVRMQENAKPNIGGMFLLLLATCTFFVTVGALSLAPVYRDLARLYDSQSNMISTQTENHKNRFTAQDARELENEMEALVAESRKLIEARSNEKEKEINNNRDRIAQIEGFLKGREK